MSTPRYFENLAQMVSLVDEELMLELLALIARELAHRGRSDARNYVAKAYSVLSATRDGAARAGE